MTLKHILTNQNDNQDDTQNGRANGKLIELGDMDQDNLDQYFDEIKTLSDYKCSAVHTLERDMPQFDYTHLVDQLKQRILDDNNENPGFYDQRDINKIQNDNWFVARFLLRHKLNVDAACDMMRKALRYKNESLAHDLRPEDFPAEFYQIAGIFPYAPDRKGNLMLYIRVKIHRKVPEIQSVLHAYIYHMLTKIDEQAKGRGISVLIDCSGGGLQNADMDTLLFFVQTLKNYFPKGLSYILVHELPWILKPFWIIAKQWIAEEHVQLIKFSNSQSIYEYIYKENLPDFLGGTCRMPYNKVPDNCTTLEQAIKLWGLEPDIVRKILMRFAEYLPKSTLERFDENRATIDKSTVEPTNHNDSDQENLELS